jgi:thiosulfate dehydrogenase
MKAFIVGFVIGLAVIPVGGYLYFSHGMAPAATSAQPMPFEEKLAHMALKARIEKEMPRQPQTVEATEANLAAGAGIYRQYCSSCHGKVGQPLSPVVQGMFPRPPHLLKGTGVTDDPAGETYWKVANGIRLSGMPAFDKTLSDLQMWQVSLLLANANKLSPAVENLLR